MNYYIWSIENNLWWRQNASGYTHLQAEAGVYTEAHAIEILRDANRYIPNRPQEAMVPAENKEPNDFHFGG